MQTNAQLVFQLINIIMQNDIEKFNSILNDNSHIDINERSANDSAPLHFAAEVGRLDMVQRLVAMGADINQKGSSGSTPLNFAAPRNHADVCEYLLAQGADQTIRNDSDRLAIQGANNRTSIILFSYCPMTKLREFKNFLKVDRAEILSQVSKYGCKDMLKRLSERGLDIEERSNFGDTLLNLASIAFPDVALELLSMGAKVDVVNREGRTALHYAAEKGHKELCEALLKHGADPACKDKMGKTPDQLAYTEGHRELALLILSFDKEFDLSTKVTQIKPTTTDVGIQYDFEGDVEIEQTKAREEYNRQLRFFMTCYNLLRGQSENIQHQFDKRFGLIEWKPAHEILGINLFTSLNLSSILQTAVALQVRFDMLARITEQFELNEVFSVIEDSAPLQATPSHDSEPSCSLDAILPSRSNPSRTIGTSTNIGTFSPIRAPQNGLYQTRTVSSRGSVTTDDFEEVDATNTEPGCVPTPTVGSSSII